MKNKAQLFVISAPSGAGKTTLIKHVLKRVKNFSYSISYTTRKPRKNEKDKQDYFFISKQEFLSKIDKGYWLEWAQVHDYYYGTSKEFIQNKLCNNENIILDIDIQGAYQIMKTKLDMVSIFIMPSDIKVLSQRLINRKTDSKKVVKKRLKNAKKEIRKKDMFEYIIVNDDLEKAIDRLCSILQQDVK